MVLGITVGHGNGAWGSRLLACVVRAGRRVPWEVARGSWSWEALSNNRMQLTRRGWSRVGAG